MVVEPSGEVVGAKLPADHDPDAVLHQIGGAIPCLLPDATDAVEGDRKEPVACLVDPRLR